MFTSLKTTLINLLGGQVVKQQITAEAPKTPVRAAKHNLPEYVTTQRTVLKGFIAPQDLSDFVSEWSKSTVANHASWINLAKAWQAFEKMMAKPVAQRDTSLVDKLLDGFHAWNSVSPRAYDKHGIEEQVIKMTMKNVGKGNLETDAIRARIRGVSLNQFKQDRERDERLRQAKQVEYIKSFLQMCEMPAICDGDYHIPVQQAVQKLENTCKFLADPARRFDDIWACSEILLIEDDIRALPGIAGRNNENSKDFVDGVLTADHMMRNGTIATENNRGKSGEASRNADVVANKQAFEDWLAAEHAA